MIDASTVREIIDLYEKHGWKLRRVLLTREMSERFSAEQDKLFGNVPCAESRLDGLWFSRSSRPGTETWELRHLSKIPYALVAGFTDGDNENDIEKTLQSIEQRMLEVTRSRIVGN